MLASSKIKIPLGIPLKITQLSDLHFSEKVSGYFLAKIRNSILKEKPDLLVFTGDFLFYSELRDEERLLEFLKSLPEAPLGNYCILGNHDYAEFPSEPGLLIKNALKRLVKPVQPTKILSSAAMHEDLLSLLSETSFKLLHNECITLKTHGKTLNLVGLGEYSLGKMMPPRLQKADLTITLLHNPDGIRHLPYHSDLILSGHTHGGQINLPFFRTRFTLMEDPALIKGLVLLDHQHIYVSRGLGSVMPFRFLCPPEIVHIMT